MDYYRYDILTDPETAQILVAYLSDVPFDTFEDNETGIAAYLPARADGSAVEPLLESLAEEFDFSWHKTFIPGQNWNEIWESNFHPVIVGDFCAVRADFHAPIAGVKWELVINPKMAFGTGHHETTWQCIAALEKLPLTGAKVLDFGCGTGILAILASKLGAVALEAVDIEPESYRNTVENCIANDVDNVTTRCGTLEAVEGGDFNGILANINRPVILESLPVLASLLQPGGWLLISGILLEDDEIVTNAASAAGFDKKWMNSRGNWLCGLFERSPQN
jgi:ribosomal protein L11 methyltransferase